VIQVVLGDIKTMPVFRRFIVLAFLCLALPSRALCENSRIGKEDCPPIAFVKRQHFDRPFGIGTIIGWDIYKPGGGIYVYDPQRGEDGIREIFQRDDGVVFDMSISYDASKLLFSWRKCRRGENRKGILSVSRVWRDDTLNHIMEFSEPWNSGQKPNHSFWDHKGGQEWVEVNFEQPERISLTGVYWFDDQPTGGCAVPESWKLYYKSASKWTPVENVANYGITKDKWNPVAFKEVETKGKYPARQYSKAGTTKRFRSIGGLFSYLRNRNRGQGITTDNKRGLSGHPSILSARW
jgi:hypothetical protein